MRGKFITFEGGEGAGKSTQAPADFRKAPDTTGRDACTCFTREPGGTPFAEAIP